MTAGQRKWHARLWAVLLPLLATGVVVALSQREERRPDSPSAEGEPGP